MELFSLVPPIVFTPATLKGLIFTVAAEETETGKTVHILKVL